MICLKIAVHKTIWIKYSKPVSVQETWWSRSSPLVVMLNRNTCTDPPHCQRGTQTTSTITSHNYRDPPEYRFYWHGDGWSNADTPGDNEPVHQCISCHAREGRCSGGKPAKCLDWGLRIAESEKSEFKIPQSEIDLDPGSYNELPRSRAARYHRYAKSSNNFNCPRYICL